MIENQEYAAQIKEMMDTAIEACVEMQTALSEDEYEAYCGIKKELSIFLQYIRGAALDLDKEIQHFQFLKAIDSVIVSLDNLGSVYTANKGMEHLLSKLEFEIIPLLEEMRANFYYWGMVYPDPKKMEIFQNEEWQYFCSNKYCNEAERTGKYKYEVSIVVLAYNKLEYTKLCVEFLKKNIPENLSYELILINHGSTDGTREFFEQVKPDKQLDVAYNGGGARAYVRIVEGKYILQISNDVLVTKNAITNMLNCIKSDEKIAWVVPSTSNVSNLQMIDIKYNSLEELEEVTEKNNVSDSRRWEQRVRLCNPIDLKRTAVMRREIEKELWGVCSTIAFPDDRVSLILRRYGYKMYLAKDAYCHHFGSVTIKDEVRQRDEERYYMEKRQQFFVFFGVDPWGKGMCYSPELVSILPINEVLEDRKIHILGIDCGFGSDPLKIKEMYKEKFGYTNVAVENITSENQYIEDLKGISDRIEAVHDVLKWVNKGNKKYDYIVVESDKFEDIGTIDNVKDYRNILSEDGVLAILADDKVTNLLVNKYPDSKSIRYDYMGKNWILITNKC